MVTHNETSTGVTNDLERNREAIRGVRPDILILVDAISSLGSVPLPIDAWDLDVVFTGSQKGWMVPPGMAMVAVSKRGVGCHRDGEDPAVLLRLQEGEELPREGPDALDARGLSLLRDGRGAAEATGRRPDGIHARHARSVS